jgi:hypothetical protein
LGWIAGLRLATLPGVHGALFFDARNRRLVIDFYERRVREVVSMNISAPRGCTFTDATSTELFVCGRVLKVRRAGRSHVVARAPTREGGSWLWAEFSRDRPAILAQWSGQCETPTAFFVSGGKLRPLGGTTYRNAPESVGLGWLPGGRAVVHFRGGVCGNGYSGPGVYAVPLTGRPQLLLSVPATPPQLLAMWGG